MEEMAKILTIYYSRKGRNYWNGSVRNIKKGNTERIAEMIQNTVGGDLFEIETIKKYSSSYLICTIEAKTEQSTKKRVAVKKFKDDLEEYDTIFVGYPNWWGTMPMVVFTFLEHYKLAGKRIIPFCTNEGSGMGSSERDLREICRGATVENGLSIYGAEAEQSEDKVIEWASKMVK